MCVSEKLRKSVKERLCVCVREAACIHLLLDALTLDFAEYPPSSVPNGLWLYVCVCMELGGEMVFLCVAHKCMCVCVCVCVCM